MLDFKVECNLIRWFTVNNKQIYSFIIGLVLSQGHNGQSYYNNKAFQKSNTSYYDYDHFSLLSDKPQYVKHLRRHRHAFYGEGLHCERH